MATSKTFRGGNGFTGLRALRAMDNCVCDRPAAPHWRPRESSARAESGERSAVSPEAPEWEAPGCRNENDDGPPLTFLSEHLDENESFLCQGLRPWLGEKDGGGGCGLPLWGSLRFATNVYYALTRKAIYLPRGDEEIPGALLELVESPSFMGLIGLLEQAGVAVTPAGLREQHSAELSRYSDEHVGAAIEAVHGGSPPSADTPGRCGG